MPSSTASDYTHNSVMGLILKNTPWTPPTSLWLALFTTIPSLNGTGGVEVSTAGTNYGRVQITAGAGWTGPSGANLEYSNTDNIQFLVPTGNWGTITGAGLYDAQTGGNLMWVSTMATSKTVSNGDGAPRVLAGQMRLSRSRC